MPETVGTMRPADLKTVGAKEGARPFRIVLRFEDRLSSRANIDETEKQRGGSFALKEKGTGLRYFARNQLHAQKAHDPRDHRRESDSDSHFQLNGPVTD